MRISLLNTWWRMKRNRSRDADSLPPVKKYRNGETQTLPVILSLLDNDDSVIAGLSSFLNAVSSPGDDETGLGLISEYLCKYPECDHIFSPLDWNQDRTFDVLIVCFKCLEQVLLYTASLPVSSKHLHILGARIVHRLLSNNLKCVYHSLRSTVPVRLVGACLRLLTAMAMQGVDSAKEILQAFNFGYKPLGTFSSRTTPISDDQFSDRRESVRNCWMTFCLAFLIIGDQYAITTLLEFKGIMSSFFNLLTKDDIKTIHLFLSTIFDKVIMNPEISKKTKSLFFPQSILKQLTLLLEHLKIRDDGGDPETLETIRNMVCTILRTLCTDFQFGICYKRKKLPDGLERTNNPVLLHFLLYLSGRLGDLNAQDLILQTLSCCPDILVSYLRSLSLKFEPQPDADWTINMTFLYKIYTSFLSVPGLLEELKDPSTHKLPLNALDIAVGLTTPLPVSRTCFSIGLQHASPVVRFHSLQLLSAVLKRAGDVVDTWGPVEKNLKFVSTFLVKYCDAILKCLPDVRTLISLRQRLHQKGSGVKTTPGKAPPPSSYMDNDCESLILSSLIGYQKISPDIFLQVNFNPAKLLPALTSDDGSCDHDNSVLSLKLNIGAHRANFNQNVEAISSMLRLTLSQNCMVSESACALLQKVLHYDIEPSKYYDFSDLVVSSIKEASSAYPKGALKLINAVSRSLSTATRDSHKCREEVRGILGLKIVLPSLQEILESPDWDEDCQEYPVTHSSSNLPIDKVKYSRLIVMKCLLSEYVREKNDGLLSLICNLLTRLLLVSGSVDSRHLLTLTLHYISSDSLTLTCSIPRLILLLDPASRGFQTLSPPMVSSPELKSWLQTISSEDFQEEMGHLLESSVGDRVLTIFFVHAFLSTMWRLQEILIEKFEIQVSSAVKSLSSLVSRGIELLGSIHPERTSAHLNMGKKFFLYPEICLNELFKWIKQCFPPVGQLAVELVVKFSSCSSYGFVQTARDMIESMEHDNSDSSGSVVSILHSIYEHQVDSVSGFPFSDSSLVSLLRLALRMNSDDLIDVVYLMLSCRTKNSLINTLCSSSDEDRLMINVKSLAKSLLNSDSLLPIADTILVDSYDEIQTVSTPLLFMKHDFQFWYISSLGISDTQSIPKPELHSYPNPLIMDADFLCELCSFCVRKGSLRSAKLLEIFCSTSVYAMKYFETHLLTEICDASHDGGDICVALCMIGKYLEQCAATVNLNVMADPVENKIKLIRKSVMEKCCQIICEGSGYSKAEQKEAGSVLKILTGLCPKVTRRLRKRCKLWLRRDIVNKYQLFICCTVAAVAKSVPLFSLILPKVIPVLLEEFRTPLNTVIEELTLTQAMCKCVTSLSSLDMSLSPDPEKWNKFLLGSLRLRITSPDTLHFISLLLPLLYGCDQTLGYTPLNELYDMIWSHSGFIDLICLSDPQYQTRRESLVELLINITELDPTVCKVAHLLVLLGVYSATRTKLDRGLLYLISKYEANGALTCKYSPFLWGKTALDQYKLKQDNYWRQSDYSEVLKLLDPRTLLESIGSFSLDVPLEPSNPFKEQACEDEYVNLYDQCFILPLLSHYLEPGSDVNCRTFIGYGCLGYVIMALSSSVEEVREAACHCLTRFQSHLEESKFSEKAQIVLLLEVLQNTIGDRNYRLPLLFGAFASRASHLFLHADNPVYSVVTHYIVHKPAFNTKDVPLLYTMLHSSSTEALSERVWILKMLCDALKSKEDYWLFKRNSIFCQVASLTHSSTLNAKGKDIANKLLRKHGAHKRKMNSVTA